MGVILEDPRVVLPALDLDDVEAGEVMDRTAQPVGARYGVEHAEVGDLE